MIDEQQIQDGFAYEQRLDKSQRTRTGAFYTSRKRAGNVVEKTLEPLLLRPDGSPKSAEELLELKLCDPACGTGIFLAEACRILAEKVGGKDAKRQVAKRCLYGYDIDPEAVRLANAMFDGLPICSVADSLRVPFPENVFDAVIGNPPFLGGRKIRRVLGDASFHFLTKTFAPGASGNADWCAYFFRLAEKLLKPGGVCGFLATNTIGQGDTRETGLGVLVRHGAQIYHVENFPWDRDAAVHVLAVCLRMPGGTPWDIPCSLDGKRVPQIHANLKTIDVSTGVRRFPENEKRCYQGWVLAGKGFLLTPQEARELLEKDPQNRDVIRPYFTGDDLFSAVDSERPIPRRFVIHFQDWDQAEAQKYPDAFRILEERVLPVREKSRRTAHRRYWWQFGDKRPALTHILREQQPQRILVQTRHAKFLIPTFVPTDAIYSESTVIFPSDSDAMFQLLNSGIHETWVRATDGTLGQELRYTPTDGFYTFPLPPLEKISYVDLHPCRKELCRQKNCGLTPLYNRFHTPDTTLSPLRERHEQNDRHVLRAYGWDDLASRNSLYAFHDTPRGRRFTLLENVQEEILRRLHELHERDARDRAKR
ncbi:MAG: N-6 DNA methylase [Planctomycetia bacterium]|nr:N-6 DNA methylase [Planctomycetia bacterium]